MKYKPTIVYIEPKKHKQLIKKLGKMNFSRWVRSKIEKEISK